MPVPSATLRRRLAAITLGVATTAIPALAQHKLGPQQTSFKAPAIAAASDEAERAIKRFTYPAGWKAELWAAEPDVAHGVAFDVADDGRVFVAESFRAWRGVPDIRGIMDWLDEDLACKSVDDRLAMMRRHLKPDQMAGYYTNTERIRLLRDTRGAGKATVSTVFAENFATPLDGVAAGVLARGQDVFFANIPNVWRLRDADGDGVADERRSISYGHGIRVGFLGHDLHGLVFGPDGRLYFSIGDRASMIQTEGHTVGTPDSGAVFRCEPDGSHLEMVYQGLRNPQDLVFDAWGNLFTGDNNSDGGDQARWTWLVEGGDSGWRIGWQFLEGRSAPNPRGPWNSEKMWHPQNNAQPAYLTPPIKNISSGPSGVSHYEGTGSGPEWNDTFTLCDFRGSSSGSGLWKFKHKAKGAGFEIVDDQKFIWSVNATDGHWGPDGSFWVLDWFDGWEPVGKGRIYRFSDPRHIQSELVRETKAILAEGFAKRSVGDLSKWLNHANYRVRLGAQFELAARQDDKALLKAALSAKTLHARIHGIWGVGQVARAQRNTAVSGARVDSLERLIPLLADTDAKVRAVAATVLGDARYGRSYEALIRLTRDSDPHTRALGTIALGKLGRRESIPAVFDLLADNADKDPYLRHAAVTALLGANDIDALVNHVRHANASVRMGILLAMRKLERNEIAAFLADASPAIVTEAARAISDQPIPGAMEAMARLIERPGLTDAPLLRRVLNANYRFGTEATARALAAYSTREDAPVNFRVEAIDALTEWPANSGRDRITGLWRPTAFARSEKVPGEALKPLANGLLAAAPAPVRAATARAAGTLKLTEASPALAALIIQGAADGAARSDALRSLSLLKTPEYAAALAAARDDKDEKVRSLATQLAVEVPPIAARNGGSGSNSGGGGSTGPLEKALASGSLTEKQSALSTLASVKGADADALLKHWLDGVLAGTVAAELELDVLEAAGQRESLKPLLTQYKSRLDAKDPSAAWKACLVGGNAEAGKKVFAERAEVSCVRCHKVQGEGGEVGPELTGLGKKNGRSYLLTSIIYPNAAIAVGFENVLVNLKGGQSYAGVIKSESATELVINSAEDGLITVKKSEITSREKGLSGMPEGFGDLLSKQDIRNLIEYLATAE
jgi:quinoprotein glucose dehydrogenase